MATARAASTVNVPGRLSRPKISTHLLQVSPRQAKNIVAQEVYPGQRAVRPHQVAFLRSLIERGHLRPGTLISFAVIDKTTRYLINGLQTLTALSETTVAPVWLQVEEIEVQTLEEAGQLYASYDRNLTRSLTDLYHADQGLQQQALPTTHLRLLSGVVALLGTGFTSLWGTTWGTHPYLALLKDTQVRIALIADWTDEWTQLRSLTGWSHATRKLVERAAVLSVALVTLRFQPDRATQFWGAVIGDSGLFVGDPAHALLSFLREHPARIYDSPTYARYVVSAWNKAYAGEPLSRCTDRRGGDAIVLAGTPHTGKAHYTYLTPEGTVVHEPVRLEN